MKELALHYHDEGRNCSQSVLRAAGAYFGFEITDRDMDMLKVLNAGFGLGMVCAVLLAGIMAFGLVADERAARRMRLAFISEFTDIFGSADCAALTRGRGSCAEIIGGAADMVQRIIEKEREYNSEPI